MRFGNIMPHNYLFMAGKDEYYEGIIDKRKSSPEGLHVESAS